MPEIYTVASNKKKLSALSFEGAAPADLLIWNRKQHQTAPNLIEKIGEGYRCVIPDNLISVHDDAYLQFLHNLVIGEVTGQVSVDLGDETFELPQELESIAEAVEESKYILELEDNFDDDGSLAPTQATWKRGVSFVINFAKWALDHTNTIIDSPKIYHGSSAGIDILWETDAYRMLIKIPKESTAPAYFYGDDHSLYAVKGTFDSRKSNHGFLLDILDL